MAFVFFVLRVGTFVFFFFFNDTATTEIYTLSLHDALPIYGFQNLDGRHLPLRILQVGLQGLARPRSEEHTSELQSLAYLVCRLLLEKKKKNNIPSMFYIQLKQTRKQLSRLTASADRMHHTT